MSNYQEILLELFKQTSFPRNPQYCVYDLLSKRNIILYGAGDGFITFSTFVLRKYGFRASVVLDRKFKTGDSFYGIPAFSPFEYKPTKEEKENAVVVVTVVKKRYHKEISDCLRNLGFKNVILASDIYEYHLLCTPVELENKGFNYYLENKKRLWHVLICLKTI